MNSLNNAKTVEILATGQVFDVHGVRTVKVGRPNVDAVEVKVKDYSATFGIRWVQVAGPNPEAQVVEYYPATA